MRKRIFATVAAVALLVPGKSRADFFGGDVAVLLEILNNSVQQLYQLMAMVQTTQDNLNLMRDINRGLNDSLQMAQTASQNTSPGLYGDWQHPDQALQGLTTIYGKAVNSKESRVQRDADRSAADAIAMHNQAFAYAAKTDQIGEEIKAASHVVSPGGAQKLTAQGVGVMMHVMNESLRTQAVGVKLQAQQMATDNHREKEATRHTLESAATLKKNMKSEPVRFTTPRF